MIKEARGFGSTIAEAKENAIAELNASEEADIQFEVIAWMPLPEPYKEGEKHE